MSRLCLLRSGAYVKVVFAQNSNSDCRYDKFIIVSIHSLLECYISPSPYCR